MNSSDIQKVLSNPNNSVLVGEVRNVETKYSLDHPSDGQDK